MRFSRRGSMKSAGLIVVAVLAVLALVLIILKFKDSGNGPAVSAVPLTGPQARQPGNDPVARSAADGLKTLAPTGAKKTGAQQIDRDLEIQVVDAASKQPLEGVELSINMQPGGSRKDRTEAAGKAWLMLPPDDPKYLSIQAKLTGYVGRHIDYRGVALPATQVIELERGTSIGGIVKDEEGNPIKGAGVSVIFPGDPKAGGRGMYQTEGPFRTDAEGKWRCDVVPADLGSLQMKLDHPDFISDESYGTTPKPADAELRAMTAVSVMKRGLMLEGIVTDLQGKPIVGASVLQGMDRFGTNQPKQKTDPDGKFSFRNARPGAVSLTVTAKNYAPEIRQAMVAKGAGPVEIKLGPGNVVKGKVVDRNGKPVGGAWVAADTWRGQRSLDWRVNTKGDGTFLWKEAPPDDVLVHLGKQGFASKRDLHVTPSDKEILITLLPPQKIHGSVVDKETGAPISNFKVVQGLGWNNPGQQNQISWQRDWGTVAGRDGQYEMEFDEPYPFRYLRIEAPGYLPIVSQGYKPEDSDVTFDAKLEKGTGPTGIVKNADGTPAAGVDVALATASAGAAMRNGVLDNRMGGNAPMVKTNDEGKFEFPPQVEKFLLIAASSAGYAELTQEQFTKSNQITLQRWGKVEGKLLISGKPSAGQQIVLSSSRSYVQGAPQFWAQYETATDNDGKFVFDRAPAGDAQVSRQVMNRTNARYSSSTYTHTAMTTIKSGQTATVQLGGLGRPLIGKLNIPKEGAEKGWQISGGLSTKQPGATTPKDIDEWAPEKQQEWWAKYSQTPEYKEMMKKQRYYNFQVGEDGAFRVEDVLPGQYHLQFNAVDQSTQQWDQVAMGQGEVTVAEIPGGYTDQPQDLGAFDLRAIKKIQIGDPMPELTLSDVDGKPLKLQDFKGKVLLMHFWATNHQPSTADMPKLKEVYDAFGKDGRLTMLGVSFDRKAEMAKAYAAKNEIKWQQAFAGQTPTIYQELGLRNFPAYMLLGADGKLIAREIPADQLKTEVEKALKR